LKEIFDFFGNKFVVAIVVVVQCSYNQISQKLVQNLESIFIKEGRRKKLFQCNPIQKLFSSGSLKLS